ncbi:hypothetical protein D3C81_1972990 [compost metagenome]
MSLKSGPLRRWPCCAPGSTFSGNKPVQPLLIDWLITASGAWWPARVLACFAQVVAVSGLRISLRCWHQSAQICSLTLVGLQVIGSNFAAFFFAEGASATACSTGSVTGSKE